MNLAPEPVALDWEAGGTSRIPFAVYADENLHKQELERFFYCSHWCNVGLEAEIPESGDFKCTVVGEADHMVTETLIRGMYEYWRKAMEAEAEPPCPLSPEGAGRQEASA